MEAREALSEPFHVAVECVSPRSEIDPNEILGKDHTLSIGHGQDQRRFHGMVKSLAPGQSWARDLRIYHIELVPRLWLLTLTRDLRIFQEKTVVEIVEQVLNENEVTNFDISNVQENHEPRPYCVQYRESAFAFISRLMEEEGIFYFFEHKEDRHTLKLADTTNAYMKSKMEEIPFHPSGEVAGSIVTWQPRFTFRTGRWRLRDYNFETPDSDMTADKDTIKKPSAFKQEVYDFPGRFSQRGRGRDLAGFHLEAHEADYELIDGSGDAATIASGATFTLKGHRSPDQKDRKVVVREIWHQATDDSHVAGHGGSGSSYRNTFTCQPSDVVFRPERSTPMPTVHGPHTAVVVGPSGEEIYTDSYGRIKVQFHWDREGKQNEKSSCWLRVAQAMAGRNWGSLFTPRIGMEVIVEFLEGDPDKPIVVGCLYNGKNNPPYGLPGNKTQSGFKSRSSPDGGSSDFNELRFEDKAGSEQIYFHAQRNFERRVERDDTLTVDRDQRNTIERDQTNAVTRDQTTIVKEGDQSTNVKLGDRTISVDVGKETTEALTKIEMKVGSNKIMIDQSGITLEGLQIKLDGKVKIEESAPMITVKGSGMLTLKGSLVRIN
jgi:type VI secretion system secreted protein VgrG